MNLNETIELYKFLQGKDIEGFKSERRKFGPKLTSEKAFSVIYVLQEQFHLIPDVYEKCSNCKELYDSSLEGETVYSFVEYEIENYERQSGVELDDNIRNKILNEIKYDMLCGYCLDKKYITLKNKIIKIIENELCNM